MRTHVGTRLRGKSKLGSLDSARSLRYSAVPTSGRGKGVPRRSYTHATRHRRSMARKEKKSNRKIEEKEEKSEKEEKKRETRARIYHRPKLRPRRDLFR